MGVVVEWRLAYLSGFVEVFDTGNGQVEATFSAGGRQPLLGVDASLLSSLQG